MNSENGQATSLEIGGMPGNVPPRFLTIDEFRRRYFSKTARPTREQVRSWIRGGTRDGVYLEGILLDGSLLVDTEGIEDFFRRLSLNCRDGAPPRRPSRRSHASRSAEALAVLRRNYGF